MKEGILSTAELLLAFQEEFWLMDLFTSCLCHLILLKTNTTEELHQVSMLLFA
jgi:hypothetical protein